MLSKLLSEAIAAWMELSVVENTDYNMAMEHKIEKLTPISLKLKESEFHKSPHPL